MEHDGQDQGTDDVRAVAAARDDPGPLDEPRPLDEPAPLTDSGVPAGEVYDWFVRGRSLLESGNAAAAVQVLGHAARAEPDSRSIRETLARAQFQAGMLPDSRASFARLVEVDPADDYARFGLGLTARRLGDLRAAVEHLSLAVAMRPDLGHYGRELAYARAALGRPARRGHRSGAA